MSYSKFFRRFALVLVWLFCFLFLVEISLRIIGYFYSKRPHLDEISTSQTFNIVCLGDSFTYGINVGPAHSYPKQLERMLNNGNLNMRFKVFNLAIPGSNSSQHLKYLEDILNRYKKPDLVIVLTGANDGWNLADSNICRVMNERRQRPNLINIKLKILASKLRIYKMLKIALLNLRGRPPESQIDDPFKRMPKYENINEGDLRSLLEYNLTRIVSLAKSNNIGIILQNYPRGDLCGDNIAERVAECAGVPFVDNFATFNESLKTSSYQDLFLYDISHPNARGNEIIAENLYRVISKMLKEDNDGPSSKYQT